MVVVERFAGVTPKAMRAHASNGPMTSSKRTRTPHPYSSPSSSTPTTSLPPFTAPALHPNLLRPNSSSSPLPIDREFHPSRFAAASVCAEKTDRLPQLPPVPQPIPSPASTFRGYRPEPRGLRSCDPSRVRAYDFRRATTPTRSPSLIERREILRRRAWSCESRHPN